MSRSVLLPLPSFVAVTLLAVAAAAQAPSPWVDLPVPTGTIQYGASAAGRLVLYRNSTFLRVFSAVTRQWHALSLSNGTTPVLAKDLLLVPESDRWTAFSAYRGVFEAVFVPFASSTMGHTDSLACVTNGNTLHTFSAFTGQWHTRTIPAGWLLQMGHRVALLRTPTTAPNLAASAFDAFTGQWHDLPAQPLGLFGEKIGGGVVTLSTLQQEFGFSPLRPGWVQSAVASSFPFPFAQMVYADGDLAPGLGSVFSGLTGTFTPSPFATSSASFSVFGNVATAIGGNQPYALAAGQGTWVALPPHANQPAGAPDIVLGYGNNERAAFSALLGSVTMVPGNGASIGGNVAVVSNGNQLQVYSAFTGQWYAPPPNAVPGIFAAANSALYLTNSGVVGFAAPSGSFVSQPGAGMTLLSGFAAVDSTAVHAFDARGPRWLSEPRPPGTLYPQLSERLLLATVPGQAFGFGTSGRQLAVQALPEVVAQVVAADDVGFVRTATHVFAFSGLPDTVVWQGDPEGSYDVGIGMTARVQVRVPANHFVVMGFGPSLASPVPLPFGELWLDPATSATVAFAATAGESRAVLPIPVPNVLSLRGTTWLQQAITLDASGALVLGVPSSLLVQ